MRRKMCPCFITLSSHRPERSDSTVLMDVKWEGPAPRSLPSYNRGKRQEEQRMVPSLMPEKPSASATPKSLLWPGYGIANGPLSVFFAHYVGYAPVMSVHSPLVPTVTTVTTSIRPLPTFVLL